MSSAESFTDRSQEAILFRLLLDVRGDYEPPMAYHGWEEHIIPGLRRIDELEDSGVAIDVNDWFMVRFAYICHDRLLTQIKLNPELKTGYECDEEVAADKSRTLALDYGLSEEFAEGVHYCIMATNSTKPCETPEARAVCRVDIGNTGDDFDIFLQNFIKVQIEAERIDQLLLNPLNAVKASCEFLNSYLRRSTLALGPEDNFPSRVERNLTRIRDMGASSIRIAFNRQVPEED